MNSYLSSIVMSLRGGGTKPAVWRGERMKNVGMQSLMMLAMMVLLFGANVAAQEKDQGLTSEALAAVASAEEAGGVAQERLHEIKGLVVRLKQADEDLAELTDDLESLKIRAERREGDYELAKRQLEASDGKGEIARSLIDQKRALPQPHEIERQKRELSGEVADVRLARLEVERALSRSGEGNQPLEKTRRKLLKALADRYDAMMTKYAELESAKSEYLSTLEKLNKLFSEELLWVRSSPVIGVDTFAGLPDGVEWLFGPDRAKELYEGFRATVSKNSFQFGSVATLVIALLLARPRFRKRMAAHIPDIRSVTSDAYRSTMEAMGFTLLISIPFSLLMWLLGRQLLYDTEASKWLEGVARGVMLMAPVLFGFIFVRELCRHEGLLDSHFRWRRSSVELLRKVVSWIGCLYVPSGVLLVMLFTEKTGEHTHTVGRVIFVVLMLWVAYWVSVLLNPKTGVASTVIEREPGSWLARLKFLWYPLAILLPVSFALMALTGYLLTALTLNGYLQVTAGIVVGAILLYFLLLRWFSIRERKMVLEARLAERQAKREAAERAGEEFVCGEEHGVGDEESLDLVQVGMQTRRLLQALVVAAGVAALWAVWADVLPALRSVDMDPVMGKATFADLVMAGLVIIATIVVAKNLPGILEIAVLRNLPIDNGGRYAAASLAQYAIVALGGLIVFNVLPLDWGQLGWAFTALSVGLGFGLQEIVANFVCGIILLFERPIRVGDIVTVSNVTGSVTKIRMRATTITDWDRREFVVPNKEFITGQLLNWTLTNTTNRIVIKIGVAYGSDTLRVQEVLMDVLTKHPDLMEDPAPVVSFDNFGDSSLDFTIRCYLPNMDRRLAVTHELYTEINKRLVEEGIEIPFPQRDLHLRSDASKGQES